jgi:hypothetical protein
MTISRIRPPAGWTDGTTVSGAEFEHFDSQLAEAVHGEGGTYVLTQPLILNGQSVTIGTDAIIGDDLLVGADAVIDGFLDIGTTLNVGTTLTVGADLIVLDDAVITENATIGGILDVTGSITSGGDIVVGDDLVVSFDAVINGLLGIGGNLTVDGTTTVAGALDANGNCFLGGSGTFTELQGNVELRGVMSLQGSSAIKARTVIGSDFDNSYSPLAASHVFASSGSVTANRSYTIDDTNASNGMRIEFSTHVAGFQISILRPGGTLIQNIQATTGGFCKLVCERVGGVWQWVDHSPYDP